LSRKSEDLENLKTSHGIWKEASPKVVNSLNKLVREPELLQLHEGLIIELTFNNGTKWSNGQIALIADLPDQAILDNWKPFPILLAPVGVRNLPCHPCAVHILLQLGWKMEEIKPCPERSLHCFGGMFGKRRQYGIRPLAATTIHKAMGNDYNKIASCIIDDGISGFHLWEKAQVLVLISRVHEMKNIIFVGDKELTARKLLEIISSLPKYALYIDYLINCLTQTTSKIPFPTINLSSTLPFHLCNAEFPKPDEVVKGYCYLIISIPQPQVTYIGETMDLHKRLHQHNSGWSHHWTKDIAYRPWAYMAYIVGFKQNRQRKRFESLWQHLTETSFPNQTGTPLQVLHIAELAISKYHEEYFITSDTGKLRMIQILSPK
jgi:predicted GIY-YIG superfamily endonuclease